MTSDVITADLKATLRRLKLGRLLDTLPERLTLARQQAMTHQDFLLVVLSDEVARRDTAAVSIRAAQAHITSNRGPDEWLATFADPLRAQSAIDRFVNNAYDLVIDDESYRKRQKPTLDTPPASGEKTKPRGEGSTSNTSRRIGIAAPGWNARENPRGNPAENPHRETGPARDQGQKAPCTAFPPRTSRTTSCSSAQSPSRNARRSSGTRGPRPTLQSARAQTG